MSIVLTGNELTFSQLYAVALHHNTVSLSPEAIVRMKASRAVVDQLVASGKTAYGINTGFGKLASVRISNEQVRQLQVNLVRSHACGVGTPLHDVMPCSTVSSRWRVASHRPGGANTSLAPSQVRSVR